MRTTSTEKPRAERTGRRLVAQTIEQHLACGGFPVLERTPARVEKRHPRGVLAGHRLQQRVQVDEIGNRRNGGGHGSGGGRSRGAGDKPGRKGKREGGQTEDFERATARQATLKGTELAVWRGGDQANVTFG
jgi:hypothetical protein